MARRRLSQAALEKLAAAEAALEVGLGIVAVKPRSKQPDVRFCKRGHRDATGRLSDVRGWLREDDTINLGAVLDGSGIAVVDVDGPAGEEALTRIGQVPTTRETATRHGRHLYFRHDGSIGSSLIGFRPKLDIKVTGYVLLPGSSHPEGGTYTSRICDAAIRRLPKQIENAIASFTTVRADERASLISEGSRNDRLTSVAGALRRQGFGENVVLTALRSINDRCCEPSLATRELRQIAKSVCRYAPEADKLFASMADVEEADVHFLWHPYIVRGAVNLLEGDPNIGKTYLLCAIAAAVSAGLPLPGQSAMEPQSVIFMSAEDDASTTLVKRLKRMGANLDNITYSTKFLQLDDEGLNWLQQHIESTRAALVILDPLLAYMSAGIDMNKANETRPFLARLAEIAKATGAAIIGLRHITKGAKDKAIYSGLGSVDIIAAARSALLVGFDPEEEEVRAVAHSKHNLSERGTTLLFRLEGGDRKRQRVPRLQWCGEADYGADALVRKPNEPGRPDDSKQAAITLLRQRLSNGPQPIAKLIRDAEAMSISARTLRRAAQEIRVIKEGQRWKVAKNVS